MAYSFLDLAHEILKSAATPRTYQQIWEDGKLAGLTEKVKTKGKTPWATLGAYLYVEVKDNSDSTFVKVGKNPVRFFLKSREAELSDTILQKIEINEAKKADPKTSYEERDLHPLLSYFVYANPLFSRGRSIFTKTIFHEKSMRRGYNEWLHPDMVGAYLPLDDWEQDAIELNKLLDNNSIRLFSFELKKFITKANYRESYFQAVSNSSWAHEGYLVAADITQDDDLHSELERLSVSFGIGIIQLNPADIDSSSVIFPAKSRDKLGWETINKLCEQNEDFKKFIKNVRIDFESKRLLHAEYDQRQKPEDLIKYIKDKLKIEQED